MSDDTDISTRCLQSRLKLVKSSTKAKQLGTVCNFSKNIFNSAVYFQRRWYDIIELLHRDCIDHLDDYITYLTASDTATLFKFCAKRKDIQNMKKLYSINPKVIQYVEDGDTKAALKSTRVTKELKPRTGKNQNNDEILSSVIRVQGLLPNFTLSSAYQHQQLREFLPAIEQVLHCVIKNKKATDEKKQKREEQNGHESALKPKKQRKTSKRAKKVLKCEEDELPTASNPTNFFPPSYLGCTYTDIYTRSFVESYKLLNSQVAQQTLRKVDQCYKSFFALRENGSKNAQPPKYIKSSRYNLIFQKDSFKIEKGNIKLSILGNEGKRTQDFAPHVYIRFSQKVLYRKEVSEVEVVPSQYEKRGELYKVIVKFNTTLPLPPTPAELETTVENKASIDMGVVNLVTMYSPALKTPIIISGAYIRSLNFECNKKINAIKAHIKTKWDQSTCTTIQDVLIYRENAIKNYFNKVSTRIINICKSHGVQELILGYNTNWKNGVNLGKDNNRTFYQVPYRKLIHMLFYKGEDHGIKVVENEESYTSKCDALALEDVGFHDTYVGKRTKRGLFQSAKNVLINADVNGAINIMRKYVNKAYNKLTGALHNIISSTPFSYFCNPRKLEGNSTQSQSMTHTGPDVAGGRDRPQRGNIAGNSA